MKYLSIYAFRHTSDIYADMNGNFFRMKDDKPVKKIFHAGRIAIRDKNKIYGIKRLRKNAVKTIKEIEICPF